MPRDDLNDPLGLDIVQADRVISGIPWAGIAFAGCGLLAFSLVAFNYVHFDANGGEPVAIASISTVKKPDQPLALPVSALPPNQLDITGSTTIAKQILTSDDAEIQSGVKVIRRGGAPPSGALIIQVPPDINAQLTPAPDRRLTEKSRFGLLPRVGADGSRPADIYARPVPVAGPLKAGAPRIAIMVGGMGLSASATQDDAGRLPGAVTLAFAPYGSELERQVAQARAGGHEVILQAPMEPFDYPQNDPGPHTLRQNLTAAETLDDLHWLMSRFTGYTGIGNFLGARFTGDPAALTPVLQDMAARGLFYVDDGSSPQSTAAEVARKVGLATLKADVIIDANSKPEAIAAALAALENLARRNGSALGIASALPGSVEQVARFAKALESRGIALVPLSALVNHMPQPAAQRQ